MSRRAQAHGWRLQSSRRPPLQLNADN
jgi:hypothetical protein